MSTQIQLKTVKMVEIEPESDVPNLRPDRPALKQHPDRPGPGIDSAAGRQSRHSALLPSAVHVDLEPIPCANLDPRRTGLSENDRDGALWTKTRIQNRELQFSSIFTSFLISLAAAGFSPAKITFGVPPVAQSKIGPDE